MKFKLTTGRCLLVIGEESDLASRVQLNESTGRSTVCGEGVRLRRARERFGGVGLNVDDVSGAAIIWDEGKFLLNL